MDLEGEFLKLGIITFADDVVTNIPTAPTNEIQIANILQQDIGWIYGLSMYADSVDPQGNTLMTTTQAQNIYLQLRNASVNFMQYIRLDDLLNTFAGSPNVRPRRYLPVNIPGTYMAAEEHRSSSKFDISTSSYLNPTGVVSPGGAAPPVVLRLKMWYINSQNASDLVKRGFFALPPIKK